MSRQDLMREAGRDRSTPWGNSQAGDAQRELERQGYSVEHSGSEVTVRDSIGRSQTVDTSRSNWENATRGSGSTMGWWGK